MANYEAVYQAVRDEMRGTWDISFMMARLEQEFGMVAYDLRRPSMLLKPRVSIDGDKWCALYGENLQDGVAGFGDSPELAFADFDKNWNEKLAATPKAETL